MQVPSAPVPVLDCGSVELLDVMGDDAAIAQAARVSFNRDATDPARDAKLIDYLMAHDHTSPFEMVELKFRIKAPILVARQLGRYRTASINEQSARYTELDDDAYLPEEEQIQPQATDNHQGRAGVFSGGQEAKAARILAEAEDATQDAYRELLDLGVAREIARNVRTVATYTTWIWKIDLHNLFRVLEQRLDPHAQWEIRQYAAVLADFACQVAPEAYAAFREHRLQGSRVSRTERQVLRTILRRIGPAMVEEELTHAGLRGRARERFRAHFLRDPESAA